MIGGKTVGIKPWLLLGVWTNGNLLAENPDFVADTVQELWDILNNN
ncbi:MAG: hypothetical protein ACLRSA_01430 [Streptococcus salivarius]